MFDPNTSRLNRELLQLIITGNRDGQNPNASGGQKSGREYAHSIYPDEIEQYSCAIELVNGDNNVEELFVFPIMPESYSHSEISEANIQRTMAGVVVTNNPTFIPFDITLQGNFGRRFKRINTQTTDTNHGRVGQGEIVVKQIFDENYKTGYGCYKILESIFRKAQKADSFYNPYKMYFYNLSLNHQYLVEPINLNPSQNYNNGNMIWNYNMTVKTIAPASAVSLNYKNSLKIMTDFSKMSRVAIFQADEIKEYKQRNFNEREKSQVEKIVERQVKGRAMGAFDTRTQSAIQAVLGLAEKPSGFDEFLINVGEGILNRNF